MRLFYFLIPLLSLTAQSAPPDCDESDLVPGDSAFCTSLTINNPVTISPSTGLFRIYMTGMTGPVVIKANISINGGPGSKDVNTFGGGNGPGGPGAHDGGGNGFGGPGPGGTDSGPDGKSHLLIESPCSSGGGGAGFAGVGESGNKCATSTYPNNGGAQAITEFDYTSLDFRGGFGGGAGGVGDDGIIGAGGGGGGAGSGGAIWLIGRGGVVNNGTIDVRGGTKGFNYTTGAHGGDGNSGRYRIENGTIITNGTNILSPANSTLKSDISCGTIAPKNNDSNTFFQMMSGFFIVAMMSALIKTLSRFPKKL